MTSDGTGTDTNIFDVESDSTTVFRVRGDGKVGIGKVTSLPAATLTVSSSNTDSDLAIAHKIHHIGDPDTYISFDDDEIQIAAGGRTFIKIEEASTDKIMINHGALDIDFQVKGNSEANLIRTDAANDRVGIGTNSPTHVLSVVGAVSASLGLSGSLTRLVDGTSYLAAGSNVTITSASITTNLDMR